jgi:2-polyprenyl-3-methyl-5-hydroxy-6-metoxy-1,4-benzoquinol methylase
MIEGAKRRQEEEGADNVEFLHATIDDERFAEGSFDVIMAFNIIHVLEHKRQTLARISQLLEPGGLLISMTPCLAERMSIGTKLSFSFYLLLMKLRLFPDFLTMFTFSELEDLIGGNGYEIIDTERMFHRMSGEFIVAKKK